MKMVCIGRNYADHAKELGNALPEEPVLFIKPSTALIAPGATIQLPSFSNNIHYELELVVYIDQTLSNTTKEQARQGFCYLGLGLDLTARDLQDALKAKGLPWERAKAFDGSAYLGAGKLAVGSDTDLMNLSFMLEIDGQMRQVGNTGEMITGILDLIQYASQYFTLETGDVLFTGTPAGVGKLISGQKLLGTLQGQPVLEVAVA